MEFIIRLGCLEMSNSINIRPSIQRLPRVGSSSIAKIFSVMLPGRWLSGSATRVTSAHKKHQQLVLRHLFQSRSRNFLLSTPYQEKQIRFSLSPLPSNGSGSLINFSLVLLPTISIPPYVWKESWIKEIGRAHV